jgi:hypothetical protein
MKTKNMKKSIYLVASLLITSFLLMSFSYSENNGDLELNNGDTRVKGYTPFYFHKGKLGQCTWAQGLIMSSDCDDDNLDWDNMRTPALNFMNKYHKPVAGGKFRYIQMQQGPTFSSIKSAQSWIMKRSREVQRKVNCYKFVKTWSKKTNNNYCK